MSKFRSLLLGSALLVAVPAFGVLPTASAADGCAVGVRSDFNGDGRSDAAVGDPFATVNGLSEAGRVLIMYGDADGKVGEGARGTVNQGAANVGGIAETGDRFATSLAAADIDCDGFTDLIVGTPNEDINGQADSGYAQVIWGSVGGLGNGEASRNLTQNNFSGLTIAAGDQFGYAVDALEDVGQGGTPAPDAYAIAIGSPGYNVSGQDNAGVVAFIAALDGGSVTSWVSQDTPGIPGGAEAGDRFGAAVSLNYLSGVADFVDAAVGVPNEDIGSSADAGAVTIVQDIYDLPEAGIGLDQNSPGVPGAVEAGDQFGRSVDTVRVGSTSRLAVGIPNEDIGSDANAGSVQLATSNGVTLTPTVALSQDTAGVSGATESGDAFGDKVAFAAPGLADGVTRLAVSAPGEDGAAVDSGLVQVFPVTDLDAEATYDQNSAGMPGVAETGDRFGSTLAVVEGATERVLLVGVPDDATNGSGMVNVIPFGGGVPRAWIPGLGGIPTGGIVRFGASVAGVTG